VFLKSIHTKEVHHYNLCKDAAHRSAIQVCFPSGLTTRFANWNQH